MIIMNDEEEKKVGMGSDMEETPDDGVMPAGSDMDKPDEMNPNGTEDEDTGE
ncbi:MAG: hypothetical protein V4665_00275 [Patescibacteria group bacterium]